MSVALFILILLITVNIVNKKNNTKANDEILTFSRSDSLIIFGCFALSILIDVVIRPLLPDIYMIIAGIGGAVFLAVLMIVNMNREKQIQKKHDEIIKIFQALSGILGKVKVEDIDFINPPFKYEFDPKSGNLNKIVVDTSIEGAKISDVTVEYAQIDVQKYFPECQWVSKLDAPNRELTFTGLPKPPKVAIFPGSDYRPTGWIPLGLSGAGEVGWNLADPKDVGISSYIDEDGKNPETVKIPSAPQCMTLGSTGGGKSIWVGQIVSIKK